MLDGHLVTLRLIILISLAHNLPVHIGRVKENLRYMRYEICSINMQGFSLRTPKKYIYSKCIWHLEIPLSALGLR